MDSGRLGGPGHFVHRPRRDGGREPGETGGVKRDDEAIGRAGCDCGDVRGGDRRAVAATRGHYTQRQGIQVQQGQGRRLSRRRHRLARRRRQLLLHRQRQRRDRGGRPRVACRRLGPARGDQGGHQQAGDHGDQHALPLRPRARQSDLRAERADHRARVHAPDAPEQFDQHAALSELPDGDARTNRGLAQARRIRGRSGCQGQTPDAASGDGEQLRLAEGAQADAAERDADDADDALSREPRDSDSLSRSRSHGR